jgi:two-component system sensor histidine kinase VicK
VTVTTRQSGDRVEVQVTDTGIGIPAEDLKDLFTEFYRAANAQEMEKEGSGLGLSIAKEIITRYGGSISVQSEVDKGSTFTFGLPLAQEHRTE